jgi:hypothetical protein
VLSPQGRRREGEEGFENVFPAMVDSIGTHTREGRLPTLMLVPYIMATLMLVPYIIADCKNGKHINADCIKLTLGGGGGALCILFRMQGDRTARGQRILKDFRKKGNMSSS